MDHSYMLIVSKRLHSVKHTDGSKVLRKTTIDSLTLVENIISDYRQARIISRSTAYKGVSSAQNTINQAKKYANDTYISKCIDLRNALNNVRAGIAQSHYNYISSQVEKLSEYRYYGQQYYENTLVPQVDAAVTEYDNKANALYGAKKMWMYYGTELEAITMKHPITITTIIINMAIMKYCVAALLMIISLPVFLKLVMIRFLQFLKQLRYKFL